MFKIVPIEGSQLVNGAAQKRADEMAAEALISLTLSRLREPGATGPASSNNVTSGFVQTYQVCLGPCWGRRLCSPADSAAALLVFATRLVADMFSCLDPESAADHSTKL